jgi:hypothetical protein
MSLMSAKAANFQVTVGGPGGVIGYTPNFVVGCLLQLAIRDVTEGKCDQTANPGDTVSFIFQQKNHTATQSTFAYPCTPAPGGFDSGLYVFLRPS